MVELLKESINRRFKNKTTFVLFIIIFSLISALFFSDVLMNKFIPSYLDKVSLNLDVDYQDLFLLNNEEKVEHKNDAEITIHQDGLYFEIQSASPLNMEEEFFLENLILNYTNTLILGTEEVSVNFLNLEKESKNEDYLYVLITGIYFMMLAYSTVVANEVVVEKATNVIELICTAVDIKIHYYSKIIIGTLTVFLQLFLILPAVSIMGLFRYRYDKGRGLFKMLYRFNILDNNYDNIQVFLQKMSINGKTISMFVLALLFLLIGLMIIQVMAVLISCRVESVEEAGALQGPFYVLLLLIYYISIFFKASKQLTHGWGYAFSFVPLFSMLLMPMKMFNGVVTIEEISLSLLLSILTLISLVFLGESYYRKKILYKKGCKN